MSSSLFYRDKDEFSVGLLYDVFALRAGRSWRKGLLGLGFRKKKGIRSKVTHWLLQERIPQRQTASAASHTTPQVETGLRILMHIHCEYSSVVFMAYLLFWRCEDCFGSKLLAFLRASYLLVAVPPIVPTGPVFRPVHSSVLPLIETSFFGVLWTLNLTSFTFLFFDCLEHGNLSLAVLYVFGPFLFVELSQLLLTVHWFGTLPTSSWFGERKKYTCYSAFYCVLLSVEFRKFALVQ